MGGHKKKKIIICGHIKCVGNFNNSAQHDIFVEDFFYKISCRLESLSDRLQFSIIIEMSKDLDVVPLFDVPNLVESLRYSNLLLRVEGMVVIYTEGVQCEEYSLRDYMISSLIDLSNYEKGIVYEEMPLAEGGIIYWPTKPKPFKRINSRELS